MAHYEFEWNDAKAAANEQKHGITFTEARTIFADRFAVESFDVIHSVEEDRFIMLGRSDRDRLLVVAYTLRDYKTIRIISARLATRRERLKYEEKSKQ